MSRYESSRFVRDPKVMNKEVLAQACDKLGWKYVFQGEDLLVTDLGGKEQLYGEYALKLSEGTVTYNSYYLQNGQELVEELKSVFFPLNVAFSILRDGTVVTDSNYLPDDVNDRAHRSMDQLQELFGRERVMTKKPEYDIFIREHGLTSSVTGKQITT